MRDQIWYTMLDAERLSRYYGQLATRFQRRQFWLNIAVAFCSLAAASVLLAKIDVIVSAVLFFVVSGGVIWGVFADYSKKAAIANVTTRECSAISVELKQLWRNPDVPGALERAISLEQRLDSITHVGLEIDDKLNRKCAEETYASANQEFGNSQGWGAEASDVTSSTATATT